MASSLRKLESVEQSRRRQRFNSHSNTYTSSNSQRIRIDINSSEELLDFKNSALVFDMEVTGGTTDVGLPRYTASSWIKEIRVKDRAGNLLGENIQDYSVLARTAFEMNVNNDAALSVFDVLEGATGVTTAAQGTTIASRQYAHQIITHIFASDNYFPAQMLGGIQLEIDINSSQDVVLQTTGQTGAIYTINNLAFVCDLVKLKPEVEATFNSSVQNGGLVVDYRSHHSVKATVSAGTAGARYDLGTLNGRVANLQAVQIASSADAAVDVNDLMIRNGTTSYRWKLGSKYLSESLIHCSATQQAEYLFEWIKSQNINCDNMAQFGNSTRLTPAALLASKFVIGQQVDRANTDMVLSSLKDRDHNRLELEVNYGDTAVLATLYVFVQMDKRMRILPGKQHMDDDFSSQGTSML